MTWDIVVGLIIKFLWSHKFFGVVTFNWRQRQWI